jgi:hypothetical protein
MTYESDLTKNDQVQSQDDADIAAKDGEALQEIMEKITDIEKKYCQIVVLQKPKSKGQALKLAGSKANAKNLGKMAWEIEQRPHVQAYMEHLRGMVVQEAGLDIQEIISNARRAIDMAFAIGKPRDVEPHNRLLADIGGFIQQKALTNATQVNIKTESNLREEEIDQDIKRLDGIINS